jgi:NAD-dependent deacetylase
VRILVLTGAGVSAESGIPTFRGRDGYWRNLDPTKLATPEAFARDPELVWDWYRERRRRIRNAQPNSAHEAIARLARHADDFLLITQNVDDLHARAGLPANKMVQIHGDIFVTRCSRCSWSTELCHAETDDIRYGDGFAGTRPSIEVSQQEHEQEFDGAASGLPRHVVACKARTWRTPKCPECGALMRPGVVWFGEQLPRNELERVKNFLNGEACGVVIVAGTTATFGYIIDWALQGCRDGGELIEVNPEETPLSRFATQLVREPAGIALRGIVDSIVRH